MREDPARLFAELAKLGIDHVEIAGLYGHAPADIRRALDAEGLLCSSIHVEPADDDIILASSDRVAALAGALGASRVVMPIFLYPPGSPPPQGPEAMEMVRAAGRAMRAEDYVRNATFLNHVATNLSGSGIRLAYHNHNVEFAPIGSGCGLDILRCETNPGLVDFQLDVGWVAAAGGDPVDWVTRLGSRLASLHLKDVAVDSAANFDLRYSYAGIGAGRINWTRLRRWVPDAIWKASFLEFGAPLGGDWRTLKKDWAHLKEYG